MGVVGALTDLVFLAFVWLLGFLAVLGLELALALVVLGLLLVVLGLVLVLARGLEGDLAWEEEDLDFEESWTV